ncbi:MAG: hypothetical protein Aurels2KO_40860 [Aureliella sp.]
MNSVLPGAIASRSCMLASVLGALILVAPTAAQERRLDQFATQELTDTYYSEGVAVGDINADGQNDIVYGPLWFEGPDFKKSHEVFAAKPQPMQRYANHFFAWVYDFDQDGFQDVFAVGFPGTPAHVYQNPGNEKLASGEHWTRHEVIDWVSNESPQFTNIVGDERPELICTRDGFFGYATIDWDQPFSSWTFHAVSEQVAPSKFGHGLGVGDVNGDGKLDILHSRGWLQQPEKPSGRWGPYQAKFGSSGGAEIYAYDVDGDGDNDIITSEAAHDFGLSWYEQTDDKGQDRFKKHVILGNHPSDNKYGVLFSELHSVALADIDGDGLKDIVTGKTYWSHHKQSPMWDAGAVVYWFKLVRQGSEVDWLPMQIDAKSGIGRQLTVADIDQDGLLDVASGGMLGAHIMMHSQAVVDQSTYEASLPKEYTGPRPRGVSTAVVRRGPSIELDAAGKLPAAIEAENLNVKVTAGTARAQDMSGFSGGVWSGKNQLWWTGARPGDKLTIPLDVLNDAPTLELALTCARDYAVVEVSLDDQPIAQPIDLFSANVISTGLLQFDTPQLTKGKHSLTIEIVGANPNAAKSYMVGLDFIRFLSAGQETNTENIFAAKNKDGRRLNLDFESGDLSDWHPDGNAFAGQPIRGDTVAGRRKDMFSLHRGKYWIGGYETDGDAPVGTLTSEKFVASQRYASFLIGGGSSDKTRVELWGASDSQPFYTARGRNVENLHRVVVDLRRVQGSEMFIRLVDESSGGWGHVNFDHFRLHARRPGPLTPAAVVLAPDEYPHRGLDAEAAAAAMRVPEGFSVSVCAAEPDVKQPIAMALDDRGRVWIAEAYEYPQRAKGDTGRDRILVFEDTTGDGRLDSRKIFAEGLNLVSGLEVGFGGVWVGAAPYLMFFADADGDDKADGPPEILLDGWGYQDTHETLNAFCWGPDGWLYGCHGVFTHSKVGKPGTPDKERTPINAGVWRYHPTEHTFEVFAHGTSNPWGVDFNEHGDAFITACVIPHLFHMIPGARYHRQGGQHFNKHTYDDIKTIADHLHYLGATPHSGNGKSDEAGGGHAHAGAMIYQGGAWPDQYNGQLLMNNIHGQRLNVDSLHRNGSGYVGSHQPDFLLTGDQASQILNMRYGPDGNVTFIDWYDMQACHRREVEVHDRSNGRIYKITCGDPKNVKVNLAGVSDLELVEHCLNSNEWYVRHSRRILQERAAKGEIAKAAIVRMRYLSREMVDSTRRLRAAWALYCCGQWQQDDFDQLIQDADPHVRGWAIRLQHQHLKSNWDDGALERLALIATNDTSPVVRRELASLLTTLETTKRWAIATALVAHAEDANDHNLPLLYWYAIEPLAEVDADRALALALGAAPGLERLGSFMLRRVAGSGDSDAVDRLTSALSKTTDPTIQRSFIRALRTALVGVRKAPMPDAWPATFASIASGDDLDLTLEAAALGLTFGDEQADKLLTASVLNERLSAAQRSGALTALSSANTPGLLDVLIPLVGANAPPELRDAAIRAMASFESDRVSNVLLQSYSDLPAQSRSAAIATLCSRASWAKELLLAVGNGPIPAQDLTADLARQLQYIDDPELAQLLDKHWGAVRATGPEKQQLIADYKRLVADRSLAAPDKALGHAIFAKTCGRCHQMFGVGEMLGPDLTGSNRTNLDYLLENIVDPSAVMAKEYQQTIVMTENGQVVTGIVRSENRNALIMQTAESEKVIPTNEIAARKLSDQSMMPENQLQAFSDHEIRSLIAYLRSKTQTPIRATEENATSLIAPAAENWNGSSSLWSFDEGIIVGRSDGLDHNEFLVSNVLASDFRLSLEIKLDENAGNSGIQFRSVARPDGSVAGYQADVGAGWWGKLYEEHGRGLLWKRSGEAHVKNDQWNRYEIEAVGTKIRTWINGQPCVELADPKGSADGIFAIQLHSRGPTTVRVRNLQLEVKQPETEPAK